MKKNKMKKLLSFAFALIALVFSIEARAQIEFDPNAVNKLVAPKELAVFADRLEAKLKNKSVGFSFTVITRDGFTVSRAGGDARRAPDANPRKMTADDQFNIASVSKTITAAAVLKLLDKNKLGVDEPIYPYLPTGWKLGDHIKSITFRELLTHRSGIRCPEGVAYVNLKGCMEKGFGIKLAVQEYNNTNYGLFRVIIPRLNGFKDGALKDDATASIVFAGFYADYVQNSVFKPLGLKGVGLKPSANNPALAYQYPSPIVAGESYGDMQEMSASQGWHMSSKQLAAFINGLLYTEKVLPKAVSERMKNEQLGLWQVYADKKLADYEHGGFYPGKNKKGELDPYQGEMNTLIAAFPNGVSVAVIINSQFGPNQSFADAARQAMKESFK